LSCGSSVDRGFIAATRGGDYFWQLKSPRWIRGASLEMIR
jgi:hypothetical protein